MKIGILGHGFIDWGGGIDFLRSFIQSLIAAAPAADVYILLPIEGPRVRARFIARRVKDLLLKRASKPPLPHEITQEFAEFTANAKVCLLDSGGRAVRNFCRNHGLDVLLPSIYPLPKRLPIHWIGFITDLQHKHMPHLFSSDERLRRDKYFDQMIRSAKTILVNSEAAKNDLQKHYSPTHCDIIALPFNAGYPSIVPNGPAALTKYEAPAEYFIISNQFWAHKDYQTAFRALAILVKSRPSAHLICTGQTNDPRHPTYFSDCLRLITGLELDSQVRILGRIPKADQLGLMMNAIAVIQPSQFEGGPGGGASYDAVGLGVPLILSDIPINRELSCEPNVSYFETGSPLALAQQMAAHLDRSTDCNRPRSATLLAQGLARRRACGRTIVAAIHSSLGGGFI